MGSKGRQGPPLPPAVHSSKNLQPKEEASWGPHKKTSAMPATAAPHPRRDSGHRPLLWSHPASRVPSSHTGAKNNLYDVRDKKKHDLWARAGAEPGVRSGSGSTTTGMPQPLIQPPFTPLLEPLTLLVPWTEKQFFFAHDFYKLGARCNRLSLGWALPVPGTPQARNRFIPNSLHQSNWAQLLTVFLLA